MVVSYERGTPVGFWADVQIHVVLVRALPPNPKLKLSTLNPQPSTLNPQPSTLNPQPSTLDPQSVVRFSLGLSVTYDDDD